MTLLKNYTLLRYTTLGIFVCIFLSLAWPAHAQESTTWMNQLGQYMGYAILNLASAVLWLGGKLLEGSVQYFVLEIGKLLGNSSDLGIAITHLWTFVRDICNLIFVFGFIYIGIRTIISDDSDAKRMLASLIVAAILINFSLYFTKIIVDFSNYIAIEIYNATFVQSGPNASLSARFAESLGLLRFYQDIPDGNTLNGLTAGGSFSFYILAAILLVVAGFVFAAGALLLVARFIVLVFIMIFSPLLFAATVFPGTKGVADMLWKQLINSALFAPAFLVLLLVSVTVIRSLTNSLGGSSNGLATALSKGTADSFLVIFVFATGIMLLIMSLKVAKSFGFAGADRAMSFAHNMRGRISRNTLGWGSNKLLKKYENDDARISNMPGWRGAINRGVRGALVKTHADKAIRSGLKAGKKSYEEHHEEDEKYAKARDAKRAEINKADNFKKILKEGTSSAPTPEQKIALERAVAGASVKFLEELDQDDRKGIVKHLTQSQFEGLEKSAELSESDKREIKEARSENLKQMYETEKDLLTKANVDVLNTLGTKYLEEEANAVRLNSSQMDELKKKLTPTEFGKVAAARENALMKLTQGNAVTSGKTSLTHDYILKQKASEIAKMPPKVLTNMAEMIPVAALTKIGQDETISREDQAAIRADIVAASKQNLSPADKEHITAAIDFLENNPVGKYFGK